MSSRMRSSVTSSRADFWRLVRNGVSGYTSVSSDGHSVLIQNGGENWRELRNLVIINITPWVIGLALMIVFPEIITWLPDVFFGR